MEIGSFPSPPSNAMSKNEMRLTYSDKVALFAKHAHLT
jgi:hypothetical protein